MRNALFLGLILIFICASGFEIGAGTPDESGTPDQSAAPAETMDADAIIGEVDKILGLNDISSKQEMTVYREDDSVRTYKMEVMTAGRDKAFADITDPPRERGRQMLKMGEVVWSYLPSVKKSIRVSGRSSFMGGDFENNDILQVNLADDYTAELVEELADEYVLELKGKDIGLAYAKVRIWINKETFQPNKQEYFTINDKLIKSAIYKDVKDFGGIKRPATVEMHSALSPKRQTVLVMVDFEKNVEHPAKMFRRSNLGK